MTPKTLVENWYDDNAELEEHRLEDGRLEFEVTLRIINDCLNELKVVESGAKILDIGGGPGRYAIKLAASGHKVTLNDLSEKSLDIAKRNAEIAGVELDATVHANALDIHKHISADTFDIVLCLGPLYHLLDIKDRTEVINHSIAAAKPGGFILLAYVTVFAHLRDMAHRDPHRLAKQWRFYEPYLSDGHYTRRPNNESFHVYPKDLPAEIQPFQDVAALEKMVSCEGFLGFHGAKSLASVDENEMNRWVDIVRMSAQEKETLNCADHIIVVLKKL